MKHKIRPAARLLHSLGKDLIMDDMAAIIELIKNSYDADATYSNIIFKSNYNNELIIEIVDDGCGMSYDTVTTKWLVPATDNKIKNAFSPSGKRRVLGEKGLGRYSASILGNHLEIITVSNGEKVTLKIDWELLASHDYLDEVEIEVDQEKTVEKNGTKIIITGDQEKLEKWNTNKKNLLSKELRKLLSPSKNDFPFNINLNFEDFPLVSYVKKKGVTIKETELFTESYHLKPYKLMDFFDYQITAKVSEKGECWYCFTSEIEVEEGSFLVTEEEISEQNKSRNSKTNIELPGAFEVDLRVFDRDPEAIERIIKRGLKDENGDYFGKLETRKLLDDISGVSIYKNDFRVRPYGEAGYDWLELNRERFLNPTFKISSNQISGMIFLDKENKKLNEKSARDGLQEDIYYFGLKYIISKIILELETRRFRIRRSQNAETKQTITGALESMFKYDELTQNITEVANKWNLPETGVKEIQLKLKESQNESKKTIKKIEKILAVYEKQATLGKLVNRLLHEGRKPLGFFNNQSNLLKKSIASFIKNPSAETAKKIEDKVNKFGVHSKFLSDLFKQIEPFSSNRKGKKGNFNLEEVMNSAYSAYEDKLKDVDFKYNFEVNDIYGYEDDFLVALANLIENSAYWLKNQENKKIEIYSHYLNGKLVVDFYDNGLGIDPKIVETKDLFELGYTSKPGGTGMGLTLAGEALKRNSFSLQVIKNSNGAHFRIEEIKGEVK